MLDRDFVHNEVAYKQKGGPAILYWVKLGLGILWCDFSPSLSLLSLLFLLSPLLLL